MAVETTFDLGTVPARLAQLGKLGESAAKHGREAVGTELLRLSQHEVPLDEGTLANSGANEEHGDEQIVSYNTPYAARLHEHPEYHFQNGRKGKYLEDPIKHNQAALRGILMLRIKEDIGL